MNRKPESRWPLPNSWVWTKLSALGDIVGGGTPSTKQPMYWTDEINWISPADLRRYSAKTIKRGTKSISRIGLANSSAKVMPAGSVHFSTRAPIGYVVISAEPLATNQGFKSLVPAPGIFNEYVYYYLMASVNYACKRASGTTFLELSSRAFGDLPIPIAPIATQHRIVAKIEELFSELDKGIESLKAARAKLKVYRQSVLKHAFEGKLTAQWREENKDKLETPDQMLARIKQEREARFAQQLQEWKAAVKKWEEGGKLGRKPTKPRRPRNFSDFADNQPLNDMWPMFELGDLISVSSGKSLTSKAMRGGRYPVYGGNGINGYHDEYLVSKPTLIIGRVGAKCGVTHITSANSWITDNALIASPLIRSFDQRYFKFLLEQKNLNILGSSTGQPVISGAKIYPVHIPLSSLAEQMVIADAIERADSSIDELTAKIDNQQLKATALRQSVLKKAFNGQLVPQNPDDQPASILLDRIKAEKAAQSQKNTRAKRRRTAAMR